MHCASLPSGCSLSDKLVIDYVNCFPGLCKLIQLIIKPERDRGNPERVRGRAEAWIVWAFCVWLVCEVGNSVTYRHWSVLMLTPGSQK